MAVRKIKLSQEQIRFYKTRDQLYFNIFNFKPSPVVLPFIKKYFPNFLKKPVPGGWSVYLGVELPKYYQTIHSVEFRTHPYFKANFCKGQLDFLTQEAENATGGIRHFRLSFTFDSFKNAKEGYKMLCSRFSLLSANSKVIKEEGKTMSIYSPTKDLEDLSRVVIILTKDELIPGIYKVYFDSGGHFLRSTFSPYD